MAQITYHLQVHETNVFQYDIFVYDKSKIKEAYEIMKKLYGKEKIIIREIENGHLKREISHEMLDELLS